MKRLKTLISQVGIVRAIWIIVYWTDKRIDKRFK